jgi:secreted trypsin-like serine protease
MRLRTVLAAVAATGIAVAAVTAGTFAYADSRIVGGQAASQTYSFMVSMQDLNGNHFCGAALVKSNVAVTAAHCVSGQDVRQMQVRVNTTDRTAGGETARITGATVHPQYDPTITGHNDVAVIKLDTQLQAAPIDIGASPGVGAPVRILGWGLTCPTRGCGDSPVQLQELGTSVLDDARCDGVDGPNELCINNANFNGGACFGDSGGPAVVDEGGTLKLVGATSRNSAHSLICGRTPSIYSDLRAQKKFIDGAL